MVKNMHIYISTILTDLGIDTGNLLIEKRFNKLHKMMILNPYTLKANIYFEYGN